MPVKLQIAVSQASLIFQKRFPDIVHNKGTDQVVCMHKLVCILIVHLSLDLTKKRASMRDRLI